MSFEKDMGALPFVVWVVFEDSHECEVWMTFLNEAHFEVRDPEVSRGLTEMFPQVFHSTRYDAFWYLISNGIVKTALTPDHNIMSL